MRFADLIAWRKSTRICSGEPVPEHMALEATLSLEM